MKRVFFVLVTFMFLGLVSKAQMTEWTWEQYKMKFEAPSNMKVTQNNATAFVGTTGKVTISIYPRTGEDLEYAEMESSLRKWARDNSVVDFDEPDYIENLNGYWGVFLDGTKNNLPVFQMLAIDPDYTEISLYIWISYNEADRDLAEEILMSFKPQ